VVVFQDPCIAAATNRTRGGPCNAPVPKAETTGAGVAEELSNRLHFDLIAQVAALLPLLHGCWLSEILGNTPTDEHWAAGKKQAPVPANPSLVLVQTVSACTKGSLARSYH
jgi:hypothetical protein